MASLDVILEDGETGGRYVVRDEGHEAEMTYSRAGASRIVIDHTSVPEALRGRGVGDAMVGQAVIDAREEGVEIIPLCPFAKAALAKRPDWSDVAP